MEVKKFPFTFGILFTIIVSVMSYILALLPILSSIGSLAIAIIISIIYRNTKGYPVNVKPGIDFAAKKLLRFAIILYGLKLNLYIIATQGIWMLLGGIVVILFSIFTLMFVNKWLKGNKDIGLLLGIGTGICGAAAIAAVSSIIKSDEEDSAISIGLIALTGTMFALVYTFLYPVLPVTDTVYGIWSGISLHEIAQVVLAAGVEDSSLSMGLLAKLSRVFLLIPVSLILMYIFSKKQHTDTKTKIDVPYFLIGFVALAVVNTFINIPESILTFIDETARFLMVMAMVGLGLNVSLQALLTKATKPLISLVITSVLLSVLSYGVIVLFT